LLRKGITEEDIMHSTELLIENEIPNLRLYFMIGLPTEEEKDIDAIIDLAKKFSITPGSGPAAKIFRSIRSSINQFIPNRTPLQWCALAMSA